MRARTLAGCVLAFAAAAALAAEEFTFDAKEFQKKPVELGGYLELKHQQYRLNQDGALYLLNFYNDPRERLEQTTATLKPSGVLRRGDASVNFRAHLEGDWETRGFERVTRFDELYASYKPDPGFTLDAGKVSLKWGKGYAWNPVAFVERAKDPNDPDLAREGYTMLTADWIRNFDGALRTIAFTPVVLPASPDINSDFGAGEHVNIAAKLYLLYRETDIDFVFLSNGSRSGRYGLDFSRNVTSNFEIHGEIARISETQRPVTGVNGQSTLVRGAATSYLLGVRHLSERETTTIVEYYRNGPGLTEQEMRNFVGFVDNAYAQYLATGNDAALQRAAALSRGGYARPNPGRSYLYLRVSQKEPFDILYFTPAVTVVANVEDRSTSIAPELLYTGYRNIELRLRAFFLQGDAGTEFGERQASRRLELQARLYF
jgi:hypothetical protein